MHKGYFRLCVAGNLLGVPLIAGWIAAMQKTPDEQAGCFFGILLWGSIPYWLIIRFYLWIYDGFASEKEK